MPRKTRNGRSGHPRNGHGGRLDADRVAKSLKRLAAKAAEVDERKVIPLRAE